MTTRYRLGIDAGGTFTDFLLVGSDGSRLAHKTSSVPLDPPRAVATGLAEMAEGLGVTPSELAASIDTIVHGTTVATNAVLTRNGAVGGVLCTEGFRDTLDLGDGTRPDPYDNRVPARQGLVPRRRVLGVRGRIDAAGTEIEPLDPKSVLDACASLAAQAVETIVVCLLHATANPSHERVVADLVKRTLPDTTVLQASELLPVVGYFDRMSTATLNAYVTPIMARYVDSLTTYLAEAGFAGTLLFMQSNGGVASVDEVKSRAVMSILSGPASAPLAAGPLLSSLSTDSALVVDMGGTSFDATVVHGGRVALVNDGWIDGIRLALPALDIHTVGAGGGSIARVSAGGLLKVGPESAGALPGPACYGRGGERATVTDADLVLGYIRPERFLNGRLALDAEAAHRVIHDQVAVPLGLGDHAAAGGVHRLTNVSMASAVRTATLERGQDPRDLPLVVAGGAGPVHAAALAMEIGISLLVVPRDSSVMCAAGMLEADFRHDYVASLHLRLGIDGLDGLEQMWGAMRSEGMERLASEGIAPAAVEIHPSLDARYLGQWFQLRVDVGSDQIARPDADLLAKAFHERHHERFGYTAPSSTIEIMAVRLAAVGLTGEGGRGAFPGPAPASGTLGAMPSRTAWDPGREAMIEFAVFDGSAAGTGASCSGPALIELENTTVVVPEGFAASMDDAGSFILRSV